MLLREEQREAPELKIHSGAPSQCWMGWSGLQQEFYGMNSGNSSTDEIPGKLHAETKRDHWGHG